jgi:hypothetical protein
MRVMLASPAGLRRVERARRGGRMSTCRRMHEQTLARPRASTQAERRGVRVNTRRRASVVKVARKTTGGRGSAEAIEKRRVARQLNTLFGTASAAKLDGRTEKRRQRLLKELKEGKVGQALKPIEIVTHANELLGLGETLASIRKNGVRTPKLDLDGTPEKVKTVLRAQEAYGFHPDVWKLLGLDLAVLESEGKSATRRRRKPDEAPARR